MPAATLTQRSQRTDSAQLRQRAEALLQQELSFIHHRDYETTCEEEVLNNTPDDIYLESEDSAEASRSDSGLPAGADVRLLSPSGEEYLFRLLNFCKSRANALRAQLSHSRPQKRLIERLERLLAVSEDCRRRIVQANLRLVAALAGRFTSTRADYEELIGEGSVILVNAVDKFDISRGFRFSTYATHAVQRHFFRYTQRHQKRSGLVVNSPMDVLADVIPDREEPTDNREFLSAAASLIDRFSTCLDDREEFIIRHRYGLTEEGTVETLKSLAEKLNLSKERVRQLQFRALEKLQELAGELKISVELD